MVDLDDIQNFQGQYRRAIEALDDPKAPIDDADRQAIMRFVDRQTGDLELSTIGLYARNLRKAAEHAPKPLVEFDEDDFYAFRRDLTTNPEYGQNGDPLAASTVHNYVVAIRALLQSWGVEWADELELSAPDPPPIDPDDMLTQADIAALREASTRNRDAAFVEFLADTGARLTLAGSLRVGDVNVEADEPYYRPNAEALGLKGAAIQEYPLIDAKAAIRTYLANTHPRPDQDDVALFHRVVEPGHPLDADDDGSVTANHLRRRINALADAAGIDKPVNPHNFRHSAITRMDREGYTRSEIEHRVHWEIDSDMWERYLHLKAEQLNQGIYSKAGITSGDDGPTAERGRCPNCNEQLPPYGDQCAWCGAGLTRAARERRDAGQEEGLDWLAEADLTPFQREVVSAALKAASRGRSGAGAGAGAHDSSATASND